MKYYIVLWLLLPLLISCEKEEVPFYVGEQGIAFYVNPNEADSTVYTFATTAVDGIERISDTIWIKMRVLGTAASHPRKIAVRAAAGTTAVAGKHYELPEIYLPADTLNVLYPLVVFNTPDMKMNKYKIVLQVMPSLDLAVGAVGEEIGGSVSLNTYEAIVSNKLERPMWWDMLIDMYFGTYSDTRYRFMISTFSGKTDFSLGPGVGISELFAYPVTLRNALKAYEAINGSLIDEFGNKVSF